MKERLRSGRSLRGGGLFQGAYLFFVGAMTGLRGSDWALGPAGWNYK